MATDECQFRNGFCRCQPEGCCPVCGDGVCEGDENECNCPGDCTSGCGGFCLQSIPVCGEFGCQTCNAQGENYENCPEDCEALDCQVCECDDTYPQCGGLCPVGTVCDNWRK